MVRRCGWLLSPALLCLGLSSANATEELDQAFRDVKTVLLRELHAKNRETRGAALQKFDAFPTLEAAKTLLDQGRGHTDAETRRGCLRTLRTFADAAGVPEWLATNLARRLKTKKLDPADHLRFCVLLCAKEEPGRRCAAAVTTEIVQTPRGLVYLIELLDEASASDDADDRGLVVPLVGYAAPYEHFGLRRALVQALTKVSRQDAVDRLAEILPNARGEMRADIARYFIDLSRGAGAMDADWQAWWKEKRTSADFTATKASYPYTPPYQTPHYHGLPLFGARIVFVLDTSGSMRGGRLQAAQAELVKVIGELSPNVQFNVLAFNETVIPWQRRSLVTAEADAKTSAARFTAALEAGGGTASYDALEAALTYNADSICFVTDGVPEGGKTADIGEILQRISAANRVGRATIHAIGIGPVNAPFLEALATRNFGKYRELR